MQTKPADSQNFSQAKGKVPVHVAIIMDG